MTIAFYQFAIFTGPSRHIYESVSQGCGHPRQFQSLFGVTLNRSFRAIVVSEMEIIDYQERYLRKMRQMRANYCGHYRTRYDLHFDLVNEVGCGRGQNECG